MLVIHNIHKIVGLSCGGYLVKTAVNLNNECVFTFDIPWVRTYRSFPIQVRLHRVAESDKYGAYVFGWQAVTQTDVDIQDIYQPTELAKQLGIILEKLKFYGT